MGRISIKYRQIKMLEPHAHLHIVGKKIIKFKINLMTGVEVVARELMSVCQNGQKFRQNRVIKNKKSRVHVHIIRRESIKFQMNLMRDVGVAEARLWMHKVRVSTGNNSIKTSRIEILKPHAHLHIIGRKGR